MIFKNGVILLLILKLVYDSNATQFRVTDQVYFDVVKEGQPLGRIVIGLFGDLAPRTVKNFKKLASRGIKGKSYKGTKFNRIIKRFMVQGGDVVSNDGKGSISIYGEYFEDENLETKHTSAGFISMANKGKDTNGCQFFITTAAAPWLDGLYTIFGKAYLASYKTNTAVLARCMSEQKKSGVAMCVMDLISTRSHFQTLETLFAQLVPHEKQTVVDGQNLVHVIEHISTDVDDKPTENVTISKCGLISTKKPFYVSDDPYDLWAWIKASTVPLTMSFSILGFFQWMIRKMEI